MKRACPQKKSGKIYCFTLVQLVYFKTRRPAHRHFYCSGPFGKTIVNIFFCGGQIQVNLTLKCRFPLPSK